MEREYHVSVKVEAYSYSSTDRCELNTKLPVVGSTRYAYEILSIFTLDSFPTEIKYDENGQPVLATSQLPSVR